MFTAVAAILGILIQAGIALGVYATQRRSSTAYGLITAGVSAVYGYGLLLSILMLFSIPWQITNVLLAVIGALALVHGPYRRAFWAGLTDLVRSARSGPTATVVIAIAALIPVLANGLKPEMSIDGQLYHGPILANLIRTGTLWGWTPANQYVYYTDLTMASSVNLASFTGTAIFDDAAQVPHLLILMFAVIWALRSRFQSTAIRAAIALLFVSAPVIWIQPRVLYVDVAYGAAVATTIFLIVFQRQWKPAHILIAGISVAAVLATKPTGILTSAVLALSLIIVLGVSSWRSAADPRRGWVKPLMLGAGILVLPMLAALAFYLRNLIAFSNPVYPVAASLGPIRLPGVIDLSIFASGERGSGFVDVGRWVTYLHGLGSGMLHGVTKLDYDPRMGGFGYIPLAFILLFVFILAVELAASRRATSAPLRILPHWREQALLIAFAAIVLAIQPSTFDSRYVIGPTAVLCVSALMTSFGMNLSRLTRIVTVVVSIAAAAVQIVWTETHVYPALKSTLDLRGLVAEYQPATPGNPWGSGQSVNWLPRGECVTIAVESLGGVGPTGFNEISSLAGLSYALYGDRFCNTVRPVTLEAFSTRSASGYPAVPENPFPRADFFVVDSSHLSQWRAEGIVNDSCWAEVQEISGTEMWPEPLLILANQCTSR